MKTMLTELPFQYLAELQLKIARRADQLREKLGGGPEDDRRLWLRAEFEILERIERSRPSVLRAEIPASATH